MLPAHHRHHRLLLLLLFVAGALRMLIAWAPLEWLLRYTLSDDSFYYLTIARNAAHGYGFTFDRLAETNGFHPLWMVVLFPIHALIEDRILAVHVVLTVSALLDVGSIYLLHSLIKRFNVNDFTHWIVLFLYAFAPILLSYAGTLNGLETALNIFCILLYLGFYQRALSSEAALRTKQVIAFGLVSGLLFLARTDNVILLSVTYLYIAFSIRKRAISLLQLVLAGGIAVAIASPWFIWSYLKTGTIIQVSALSLGYAMKTFLNEQGWTSADLVVQCFRNLANTATFFPVYLYGTRIISIPTGIVVAMMAYLVFGVFNKNRYVGTAERLWDRWDWLAAPVIACGLFVLAQTCRAVYMRGWYYASMFPVLLLGLAVLLNYRLRGRESGAYKNFGILGGVLIAFLIAGGSSLKPHHGEIDKWEMVNVMNRTLPPDSRVGSWNAGLYGYFFDKGTVVGLDGLVNNEVYDHIVRRTVLEYCRQRRIEYIVDPVGSINFAGTFWMKEGESPLHSLVPIDSVFGQKENNWIVLGRLNY